MFPVLGVNLLCQGKSICRFHVLYPVNSRSLFSLVVFALPFAPLFALRLRIYQKFLQFVNSPCVSTLAGLIDAFLDAVYILLSLAPGQFVPSLARRVNRW